LTPEKTAGEKSDHSDDAQFRVARLAISEKFGHFLTALAKKKRIWLFCEIWQFLRFVTVNFFFWKNHYNHKETKEKICTQTSQNEVTKKCSIMI